MRTISILLGLCLAGATFAQKTVYIPQFIIRDGVDVTKPDAQWSNSRKVETENWVIFWEPGFGSDPSTAPGAYRVDMEALKATAERSYTVYVDSLRMAIRGSSVVDKHKQMIFLLYTTDWGAWGSGQDDLVGTLHVNPAAANIATVVAHEIGHTFQYITGCDVRGAGYRWGFGANGAGGNGYWEQVANWLAFKVYPERQFTAGDFNEYIRNNHLHILHEDPRYANYFLPDYWAFKRGPHFQSRLWREARRPEDPVETYKRLTSVTQETFNDEMYEHASRLTTWDLPAIRSYGASYIDRRAQVAMTRQSDGGWLVNPAVTPQNYGYNSIKLNAPANATTVSVDFEGRTGAPGYRNLETSKGGWRYGFVALLRNGTRVYSTMAKANMSGTTNPKGRLDFDVPANTSNLWLVVSGAPQEHWKHPWDDTTINDEQWPYQVRFGNTNLLGQTNLPPTGVERNPVSKNDLLVLDNGVLRLGVAASQAEILDAQGRVMGSLGGTSAIRSISMSALPRGLLLVRTRSTGTTETTTRILANTAR